MVSRAFFGERHSVLQARITALLDAKRGGPAAVRPALATFVEALEAYLALDVHLGYRLLMRETDVERRVSIVKMLEEQGGFSMHFDTFARRWKDADDEALQRPAFAADLETLVTLLMHRIKTEQAVVAFLADIA